MVTENYYSKSMMSKSDAELQEYIIYNADYQEEAVLAAIWELEKRGLNSEEITAIKTRLETNEFSGEKAKMKIGDKDIALYSFSFIILFGVLFSVFAGSILISLNLVQLKNKTLSRLAILLGLSYSLLQVYLMNLFKIKSPFISILSSFLGIYLLYNYLIKPALKPNTIYITRSSWQPLLIGFLISMPIAYFLMKSGSAV